MSQFAKFAPLAVLGPIVLAVLGCSNSPPIDAKTLEMHRTRLVMADEPDGVQTVADVRVALLGEAHDPHAGHDHAAEGHEDHDAEDHAAEDHDAEDHGEEGHDADGHEDHAGHDEDGEDHAEHDGAGEDHEGHDHGAEEHSSTEHDEHAGHDHDAHAGHDHDGNAAGAHAAGAHGEAAHADETESIEVSMVGHVGGLANPWGAVHPDFPFAKTQAVLFLADPQGVVENAASGHSHAPGEECAFCAAHAADKADMLAMVQFVDEKGDVLPMDVRQLFDVKEQDMVVVRGKARVTPGGILVLDAQGLYIRK